MTINRTKIKKADDNKSYSEMMRFLANNFKEDYNIFETFILNDFIWYGTLANRNTTQRLNRKGIIIPIRRGVYKVNPNIITIFQNCHEIDKPKENIPTFL